MGPLPWPERTVRCWVSPRRHLGGRTEGRGLQPAPESGDTVVMTVALTKCAVCCRGQSGPCCPPRVDESWDLASVQATLLLGRSSPRHPLPGSAPRPVLPGASSGNTSVEVLTHPSVCPPPPLQTKSDVHPSSGPRPGSHQKGGQTDRGVDG